MAINDIRHVTYRAVGAALGCVQHGAAVELGLLADLEPGKVKSSRRESTECNHDASADEAGLELAESTTGSLDDCQLSTYRSDSLLGSSAAGARACGTTLGILVTGTVDGHGTDSVDTLVVRSGVSIVGNKHDIRALKLSLSYVESARVYAQWKPGCCSCHRDRSSGWSQRPRPRSRESSSRELGCTRYRGLY